MCAMAVPIAPLDRRRPCLERPTLSLYLRLLGLIVKSLERNNSITHQHETVSLLDLIILALLRFIHPSREEEFSIRRGRLKTQSSVPPQPSTQNVPP